MVCRTVEEVAAQRTRVFRIQILADHTQILACRIRQSPACRNHQNHPRSLHRIHLVWVPVLALESGEPLQALPMGPRRHLKSDVVIKKMYCNANV